MKPLAFRAPISLVMASLVSVLVVIATAVHGLIRVRDRVKFEFDIVGHKR